MLSFGAWWCFWYSTCVVSFHFLELFSIILFPSAPPAGVGVLMNLIIFSFNALTWGTRISTLGSDTSGGSVYILNLVEPLDFNRSIPVIRRRIHEVVSFNCSIWTTDCESSGGRAVIGTFLLFPLVFQMHRILIFESPPVLVSHIFWP